MVGLTCTSVTLIMRRFTCVNYYCFQFLKVMYDRHICFFLQYQSTDKSILIRSHIDAHNIDVSQSRVAISHYTRVEIKYPIWENIRKHSHLRNITFFISTILVGKQARLICNHNDDDNNLALGLVIKCHPSK